MRQGITTSFALALGVSFGCDTAEPSEPRAMGEADELPLGEFDPGDLKGDGWGAALKCKDIPELPPLVDPEITISVDGLTLHLVDRAGDYDEVFPVGVGAMDLDAGSSTFGESHTMWPVLNDGTKDFTIDTTTNWTFNPCRIWWTSSDTGEKVPVFAGLPFIRFRGAYGIHGPITGFTEPNGGRLERGYVSHGCVRMEAADVVEVYARISGVDDVPVHVQREPERADNGSRVDVPAAQRWVGSECSRDADCGFDGGFCRDNPYSDHGTCAMACEGLCPESEGYPTTFCVEDDQVENAGYCTLRAVAKNFECRPGDQLVARTEERFGGTGQTEACVPGTRGWIGDPCLASDECRDDLHCSEGGGLGVCTASCELFCPDLPGAAPTFCADDPDLGGGHCLTQCSPQSNAPECSAGTRCEPRTRPGTSVAADVCVPV